MMATAIKNSSKFLHEGDDLAVDIRDYSVHPGSGNDETAGIQKALDDLVNVDPSDSKKRYTHALYFPIENGNREYIISQITPKGRGLTIFSLRGSYDSTDRHPGPYFKSEGSTAGSSEKFMINCTINDMGLNNDTNGLSGIIIDGMGFKGDFDGTGSTLPGASGIDFNANNGSGQGIVVQNCTFWDIHTPIRIQGIFSSVFRNLKMGIYSAWGFRCSSGGTQCLLENVYPIVQSSNFANGGFLLESGDWKLINCNGIDANSSGDNRRWLLINGPNTHVVMIGCNVEEPGGSDYPSKPDKAALQIGANDCSLTLISTRFRLTDFNDYQLLHIEDGKTGNRVFFDESTYFSLGSGVQLAQNESEGIIGTIPDTSNIVEVAGKQVVVNGSTSSTLKPKNYKIAVNGLNTPMASVDSISNLGEIRYPDLLTAFRNYWVNDLARVSEDPSSTPIDSITKDSPSADEHRVVIDSGSHGLSVGDVIEITGTANGWDGFFEVINDVNTTTFDVRWTGATGTNETSSSGSFTQRSSSSFSGGHVYYDDANSSLHRLEDYTQFGPVKT